MHTEMSTCEVLSLIFVFLSPSLLSSPLTSSVTLFRMRVSKCQPADYREPVNGLISRFHGGRKSCQSQYVRCYKSQPSIRALKHALSTHGFTPQTSRRKKHKGRHTRRAHLGQFSAKITTMEKLGPMRFPVDVFEAMFQQMWISSNDAYLYFSFSQL